ncbi:hypothetical protein Tco_0259515, partial [Tanacetum coccineum]
WKIEIHDVDSLLAQLTAVQLAVSDPPMFLRAAVIIQGLLRSRNALEYVLDLEEERAGKWQRREKMR